MLPTTYGAIPTEHTLGDEGWPQARYIFHKAQGPYTTVALVLPLEVCNSSGVAHVLEHLLFRGSKKYPDRNLLVEAKRSLQCLDINASTQIDHLVLHVTSAHRSDLDHAFNAYFDAVQQPSLDPRHFEQERRIVISEMKAFMASENANYDEIVNVGGDPDLLEQLHHSSLQSFWRHQCHPSRFILVVVGEEPLTFSYPIPRCKPFRYVMNSAPITTEHLYSKGVLLHLISRKVSERLDSLMMQSIARVQDWVCRENSSTVTLWHSDPAAIEILQLKVVEVDEASEFEQWLGEIEKKMLDIGSATHHFTVELANIIATEAIRGTCCEHMITQPDDIKVFTERWRDRNWRKDYAEELRVVNSHQRIFSELS